jgi:serine protease
LLPDWPAEPALATAPIGLGARTGCRLCAVVDGGLCASSGEWDGNIVLCERGDIDFADKVANAKGSGGAAAIIYNNVEGSFSGTLGEEVDWIPAITLSQEDGIALRSYLEAEVAFESFAPFVGSGYEAWGGTSMATPHVSGVAAVLWSSNSDLTNAQIREAMTMTAMDLGVEGWDPSYGYGLVQAYDAFQYLQNQKPCGGPCGPKK